MKVKISVIDKEDCLLDVEVRVYDEEDKKELIEFVKAAVQAYEDYSFEKGVDLINNMR